MQFIQHKFPGVIEFIPTKYFDERGHFYESYNQKLFSANGISENFVQDNYSFSTKGVIHKTSAPNLLKYPSSTFAVMPLMSPPS